MRLRPRIAIDLGTVNTLIDVAGRGLVVDEPSVVALERATGKVAAVGTPAEMLSGKEPQGIDVIWPLRDGVITDLEASTLMLNAFLRKARVHRRLWRPLAVICVPKGATWVERRAVASALTSRSPHCTVRLVDEPVGASVGAGITPSSGESIFVVDVGGGTTEVAVVAGGGVVRARSLRVGGNAMDVSIAQAVKEHFGLALGRRTSERLKIALGLTGGETGYVDIIGVDTVQERRRAERIPGELVANALEHVVAMIAGAVQDVLTEIPPDAADDIFASKIRLVGGGALLLGLADRIESSTGIDTLLVDDPLRCVVRGAASILLDGKGIGLVTSNGDADATSLRGFRLARP